jgi:hypothetical protein
MFNSPVSKCALIAATLMTVAPNIALADAITAKSANAKNADFDIVKTEIVLNGEIASFKIAVSGKAGASRPLPSGKLAGTSVYSYVWPTSLNSSAVGFEPDQGILALAVTAHPDFDDTPLADENGDGDKTNDGDLWHSHWVVLGPDDACGKGSLKVMDIPEGAKPKLPATWPGLPILLDSPGFEPVVSEKTVTVNIPAAALGDASKLKFDGVTAGLRVNASTHSPLLCVADVFDVASGDLGLPGAPTKQ